MIRVLVADDEEPGRAKLRRLLSDHEDVEIVAEAADGEEAVAGIRELAPDLVFLDVQMPRGDGFEVVERIGPERMPLVVFATAFDQHALRAFEVHAFDYLLKPFAPSRFRRLMERVRERLEAGRGADPALVERLERLLGEVRSARPIERILARADEDREVFVAVSEIDFLRAQGNLVELHTPAGVYRRRETLGSLEQRLDADRFLRINRSEIVRLDAVAEVRKWFHGDSKVVLRDRTVLSWSRRYRSRVKNEL